MSLYILKNLNLFLITLIYNTDSKVRRKSKMPLELYYNDITIRLVTLITLSFILNIFYLKHIIQTDNQSFFKQEKSIYSIQFVFWILFLSNLFDLFLPNSFVGWFIFELILLTIIFISLTFLLWKLFHKKRFDFGILFFSLPLVLLFLLALGMT